MNMQDEGAIALAHALRRNKTILEVDLSDNCIADDGAIALAESLKSRNRTLTSLDLRDNDISEFGLFAFEELVKDHNHIIRVLEVSGDYYAKDNIEKALDKNAIGSWLRVEARLQIEREKKEEARLKAELADVLKKKGSLGE